MQLLRLTALGSWLGGMLAFAFIFAPTAFAHIGPTPAFAATIAATLVTLTRAGFVCAALAIIATLRLYASDRMRRFGVIITGVVVATIAGIFELAIIIPSMRNTPLGTHAYDALHHQSSTVYSVALIAVATAFAVATFSHPRIRY